MVTNTLVVPIVSASRKHNSAALACQQIVIIVAGAQVLCLTNQLKQMFLLSRKIIRCEVGDKHDL